MCVLVGYGTFPFEDFTFALLISHFGQALLELGLFSKVLRCKFASLTSVCSMQSLHRLFYSHFISKQNVKLNISGRIVSTLSLTGGSWLLQERIIAVDNQLYDIFSLIHPSIHLKVFWYGHHYHFKDITWFPIRS